MFMTGLVRRFDGIKSTLLTLGILLAVVAAALFAARTISGYQRTAHGEYEARKIMIQLESLAEGEAARNAVVINRGRFSEDEIKGFQAFRPQIDEYLREIGQLKKTDEIAPAIREISRAYWAKVDELAPLGAAGNLIEARAGVPVLAEIHEQRASLITEATTKYEAQARQAEQRTYQATLIITLGGAAFVSLLVWALSRQRTSSQINRIRTKLVEESEARFRSLIQNAASVITVVNDKSAIQYQSATVESTFGYKPTDLLHSDFTDLVHPEEHDLFTSMMRKTLLEPGSSQTIEVRLRDHAGAWIETETVAQNLTTDTHIRGVVLTARDISERKKLEQQLTRQALHDPLTGLPNRLLFRERLEHALERGIRSGHSHAVLFLDMDDFKLVNDSLGHLAGDEFLISVGRRLSGCIRSRDTVARFGGDEFAVLLENASEEELNEVASRLMAAFSAPFKIGGREIQATASLGIVSAKDKLDPNELLRDADTAMYIAKARGKGRSELFTPAMHTAVVDRLDLERDLRAGIVRGEFVVHYQPMLGFDSDTVVALEALARWEHPTRGELMPMQFIAMAEETGLIVPLGEFVLRTACADVAEWSKRFNKEIVLTVNLSARQLLDADLAKKISSVLVETGFPAANLVLEITETVLAESTPLLIQRLEDLRAIGLRLAIDDFGTGYSSLSYIQDFPVDIVKIDKSFVDGITGDNASTALPEAIVSLAKALKLKTVAEGVELTRQRDRLSAIGCDLWQGYLFSKPLSKHDTDELLSEGFAIGAEKPKLKKAS